MSACYRDNEGHFIKGRHDEHPEGWEGACPGCKPCPERHCEDCRKQHLSFGENTCASCIGRTRTNLRTLVDLYACLPEEVEHRGVDSEAANLHGPATDAEAWSWRKAARSKRENVPLSSLEPDDEQHPLSVLGRWVYALGEDYGDPTGLKLTISRAVDYLDQRLGRIAHDAGQDWGLFAAEVRRCRAHLEAVLHDGEQRDLTRVPCLDCGRRLERRYAEKTVDDHHVCTNHQCDRRTYTHNEFVMAKRQWLNDEGADHHVKMQDARDVVERPRRTWDKWLRLWFVRSYRDQAGQVWVWWPDVREVDHATPRRNRSAA